RQPFGFVRRYGRGCGGNRFRLLGVLVRRGHGLAAGINLVTGVVHIFTVAVGHRLAAIAAPTSHRSPRRPGERTGDGICRPAWVFLPEIARVVFLVLVADFVTALLTVLLRLLPVLDPLGTVLSKILARSAGAPGIYARSVSSNGRRSSPSRC